jgi:hypothetical protein
MRRQFWVVVALGGGSAVLAIATVASRGWIEVIFRVDPDHGDGRVEWAIVIVMALIAIVCLSWARAEWRRTQAVAAVH